MKADNRVCGNDLTNYIYDYHEDKFEYLEKRNDAGIFFDFDWDKDNKKIITKRDKGYPIVKFSFISFRILLVTVNISFQSRLELSLLFFLPALYCGK